MYAPSGPRQRRKRVLSFGIGTPSAPSVTVLEVTNSQLVNGVSREICASTRSAALISQASTWVCSLPLAVEVTVTVAAESTKSTSVRGASFEEHPADARRTTRNDRDRLSWRMVFLLPY